MRRRHVLLSSLPALGLPLAGWGQTSASTTTSPAAPADLPRVSHGRIERLPPLRSRHVDARHIDVWLPADYRADEPDRRYPVLYMHDGQMLFDATRTWNKQSWRVPATMSLLAAEKLIPEAIVVGIWNNGDLRHSEYYPQKFLPHVPEPLRTAFVQQALRGQARSDAYLRFLVEEVKPAIDARYATRRTRESTQIIGSSMGGLISLYAMCEYPAVFGGAACLSTHWIGSFEANDALPQAALAYLREHLATPADHRLYMDHGTLGLDALYGPHQARVNALATERGYSASQGMWRVFPGADHHETAWASRLHLPLRFLLSDL